MTVTLQLEPELEQGLQAQAQARGLTVEHLIREMVSQQVRVPVPRVAASRALNLPARNLGDVGSLHRRDIYDDVR